MFELPRRGKWHDSPRMPNRKARRILNPLRAFDFFNAKRQSGREAEGFGRAVVLNRRNNRAARWGHRALPPLTANCQPLTAKKGKTMIAPPKDSTASKPKKTTKKQPFSAARLFVWIVVIAVLAILAFVAVKFHFGAMGSSRPTGPDSGAMGSLRPTEAGEKRVPPKAAATNKVAKAGKAAQGKGGGAAKKEKPREKDWQTIQREAMAKKLGRKKEHEVVVNDSNTLGENGRKPFYRNSTEHIMSMVFTTGLGEMPLPLPKVSERDKKRMAEILLDKFEILPDDPDAEEKKTINAVKNALGEHIRNGGDIDEFFSSYHRQLEMAHRERMDARNMVLETAKGGDAALAAELLDKYNRNLESKGIKPINLPQWVIEKKAEKK